MSGRIVRATSRADGSTVVLATTVGLVRDLPEIGDVVVPGRPIGRVETLGRFEVLLAPLDLGGRVVERMVPNLARAPVGYDTPLIRIDPLAAIDVRQSAVGASGAHELVFRAPMAGRFYTRPAPTKPPMIEVGGFVETGQGIGLLEVMKTFNRVVYGGEGLPERARVLRIVPSDGDDVHRGAVLLELEPA